MQNKNKTESGKLCLTKSLNCYLGKFSGNRFNDPEDYYDYLEAHLKSEYIQLNKLLSCAESLRVALANNPLSWVEKFGSQGVQLILKVLDVALKK